MQFYQDVLGRKCTISLSEKKVPEDIRNELYEIIMVYITENQNVPLCSVRLIKTGAVIANLSITALLIQDKGSVFRTS